MKKISTANGTNTSVTFDGVTNPAGDYVFTGVESGTYTYEVTHDGYQTVTGTVTVEKDTTVTVTMLATGIETVQSSKIKIYNEGLSLIVESDIAIASVEIYNPLGQAIRTVRADSNRAKIDNLPSGILVVKVLLQDGRSETKKILMK